VASDIEQFGSPAPVSMTVHAAWVLGNFVDFGVLAVLGYRRDLQLRLR
jgi:hypothetical protein